MPPFDHYLRMYNDGNCSEGSIYILKVMLLWPSTIRKVGYYFWVHYLYGHLEWKSVDLKRSVYLKRETDFAVCFCNQCLNIETWSNSFQIAMHILNKRLRQVSTCIILVFLSENGKGENRWKNISWHSRLFVRLWKTWQTNLLSYMWKQIGRNEVKTIFWWYCFKFRSRKHIDQSYKWHRLAPSSNRAFL